jgi:hypothetical protein
MLRTRTIEDQLRKGRLEAKTLDSMFRRRIEEGANCAPFVSQAILKTVKELYPLDHDDLQRQLDVGQIKLLVVAAEEPPGKPLDQCQKVPVMLTFDAGHDDLEVRAWRGVTGLRRTRILRMCCQAREQGGLLSYEDLAYRLLNCGTRTIVRDVEDLRTEGLVVPTRGQQQDIGPGQTHRVKAVELFLEGHEPREIAQRLYHSLSSIENYVTTFGRVALLANNGYGDDEIAFIIRRSSVLVAAYCKLYEEHASRRSSRNRLHEILSRVESGFSSANNAKKGGSAR